MTSSSSLTRHALRLAACAALAAPSLLATEAQADTLSLTPAAAEACPACATPTGGAEAVNLLATLAPQDISLTPADGAGAPPEGFAAVASRMAEAAETLDAAVEGGGVAAGELVEEGLVSGLVEGGAITGLPALCAIGAYLCPIVAVGAVSVPLVFVGAKMLSTRLYGGDQPEGTEADNVWWQESASELRTFDSNRGPVVHAGEWYMTYTTGNQVWSWMHHYRGSGPVHPLADCNNFGPQPPAVGIVRQGVGDICLADFPLEAYVRTPEMMYSARYPAKRITTVPPGGQTITAPPAPSRTQLNQGVSDALNDNLTLAAWLNYQLRTPGAQDPISGKVIVPDCNGLIWTQCRDQMEGYGFATPVKLVVADDETALAPAVAAGEVALVEAEATGRDTDDVLGVAVMPDTISDPRTTPTDDLDTENDVEVINADTDSCNISAPENLPKPAWDNAFDYHPSLLVGPDTYAVNTTSALALSGSTVERESETMMLKGAVKSDDGGFGWRHTAVRHGWTDKDELFTRTTLGTPFHAISRDESPNGTIRDVYYSFETSGAWYFHRSLVSLFLCARRVVVNPTRLGSYADLTQPTTGLNATQTGIVTSYGKTVASRPLP